MLVFKSKKVGKVYGRWILLTTQYERTINKLYALPGHNGHAKIMAVKEFESKQKYTYEEYITSLHVCLFYEIISRNYKW